MKDLIGCINNELTSHVKYALRLDTCSFSIIPSSCDNYVFFDKQNRLIARVSLNKLSSDVKSEVELLNYLVDHNFPAPKALYSSSVKVENIQYPIVVFRYIEHIKNWDIGKSQVELAARYLANLHTHTMNFCEENSFTQSRILEQDIVMLWEKTMINDSNVRDQEQLIEDLEWGINFLKSQSLKNRKLVLHNDYRSQNILLANSNEIVNVIDFDWSIASPFALKDLGHAALEWAYPDAGQLDKNLYKIFIDRYWAATPPVDKVPTYEVKLWSRFAALADAAHYFLNFPDRTRNKFQSYMYDKYLFLKNNEI